MSDVDRIPDALRAHRRAAQWLSLQARQDQTGIDRLTEAIGTDPAEWANLAGALAYIAQEQGVAQHGAPAAWIRYLEALAAVVYGIEEQQEALADQVRARERSGRDGIRA